MYLSRALVLNKILKKRERERESEMRARENKNNPPYRVNICFTIQKYASVKKKGERSFPVEDRYDELSDVCVSSRIATHARVD